MSQRFIIAAETLQSDCVLGTNIGVPRIIFECWPEMFSRFIRLTLVEQDLAQVIVGGLCRRIERQRSFELRSGSSEPICLLQADPILHMGSLGGRQICYHKALPIHLGNFAPGLAEPERAQWDNEYRNPF